MKNKIKRFAKGDFHIPQPEIIFPETHIIMRVGEGEKYQGSFSLQNEGEGTIRGLVYPSSYRIQCVEQGFDGNPVNIYYTYDGRGLVPGHVEHGKFTIVCNGGEYDIAFTAIIEKPFVMTRYGKIQSLEDFKKLSYRDAAEAVKLFRSRDFYEILKYEDQLCSIRVTHVSGFTCNPFFQILRIRPHFEHFLIVVGFKYQIMGFTDIMSSCRSNLSKVG